MCEGGFWRYDGRVVRASFRLCHACVRHMARPRLAGHVPSAPSQMSNDVRILLPAMVAIMLAKFVADAATHSLYHGLLEVKCVPFLPKDVSTRRHGCLYRRWPVGQGRSYCAGMCSALCMALPPSAATRCTSCPRMGHQRRRRPGARQAQHWGASTAGSSGSPCPALPRWAPSYMSVACQLHSVAQLLAAAFPPQPVSTMDLDLLEVRSVMHAPVVTLREQMRLGDIRCGVGRDGVGRGGAATQSASRGRGGLVSQQTACAITALRASQRAASEASEGGVRRAVGLRGLHDFCATQAARPLRSPPPPACDRAVRAGPRRDVLRKTRHNGFPVVRDTPQVRVRPGTSPCRHAPPRMRQPWPSVPASGVPVEHRPGWLGTQLLASLLVAPRGHGPALSGSSGVGKCVGQALRPSTSC